MLKIIHSKWFVLFTPFALFKNVTFALHVLWFLCSVWVRTQFCWYGLHIRNKYLDKIITKAISVRLLAWVVLARNKDDCWINISLSLCVCSFKLYTKLTVNPSFVRRMFDLIFAFFSLSLSVSSISRHYDRIVWYSREDCLAIF